MKQYQTVPNAPNLFFDKEHLKKEFKTYCNAKIATEKGLYRDDIKAIQALVTIEEMMNRLEFDLYTNDEMNPDLYIALSKEARELKHEIFN